MKCSYFLPVLALISHEINHEIGETYCELVFDILKKRIRNHLNSFPKESPIFTDVDLPNSLAESVQTPRKAFMPIVREILNCSQEN